MPISVSTGFLVTDAEIADIKTLCASSASLSASLVPITMRYPGLTVYVQDVDSVYRLVGGILESNWVLISSASVVPTSLTASYLLGGSGVSPGGSYNISSSWASSSLSASYVSGSGTGSLCGLFF